MSQDASARPVITLDEMNARIEEIEAQRNGAQARCARLAGEKAMALRLLGEAQIEIDRLNGLLAEKTAANSASGDETAH